MKKIVKKLGFIITLNLLIMSMGFSQSKICGLAKTTSDTFSYDEVVVDIGALHNYVSNSTCVSPGHSNYQTFMIGRGDLKKPSMMWMEGGYENNHYLYYGAFHIGYNNDDIRFNTATSNDFQIDINNPYKLSPFEVSFSMTDDSAGSHKVGVKCICKVNAWPEPPRDDVLLYEYLVINNSDHIMEDVYCALVLDCDISFAAGGSGINSYARDDMPEFLLGLDKNGNPESISYGYDADNPNIVGNDIGGIFLPKESLGYIGSRIVECPSSNNDVPANQQSGHYWWDW
jgi:hypothetical protein